MTGRRILHVDMDAFYASVEQRDEPSLRGLPVVVGGGENRGVVAAASYEAREFGIRSAMPMAEARRRCPELVRVQPRMAHYQRISRDIFAIFREFTPVVEGLSLDEAFLDVTRSSRLFGDSRQVAAAIKQRVLAATGLTASVGVAWNKLVAKIASDLDKPDGLVVVTPNSCARTLDPLPVSVIPGIGRKTLQRLQAVDIRTVGQLRQADDRVLEPIFGRFTRKTRDRAAGIDDRAVVADRIEKSISAEETFDVDLADTADLERELLRLTERACRRMRSKGLAAGTVQVKIRRADFTTYTRQRSLTPPANGTDQVFAAARRLLAAWRCDYPEARIRLLGVGGSRLVQSAQQDLFGTTVTTAGTAVDRTVDDIRARFGDASVARARTLPPSERDH